MDGMAQVDSVTQTLERVEVVAMRHTDAVHSSIPMQEIDQQNMLQLGLHSISDVLKHMAGLTLRDYGGAGGMKTVSVRGIGARHTAVVYDGIALSDCQTGEIDLSRFSLNHLSSVSLVIGDGDNIFQPARNQAAAATLELTTKQETHPQPLPWREGSDYSLSLGSFGLINPSFHLILPPLVGGAGRGLLLSATGDFFHADNDYPFTLRNGAFTTHEHRTNSRINTGHVELNGDWQMNADNILSAKVFYYDSNRRLPGIVHYYTSENHERLCEQNAFGQLRFHSQLSERWALLAHAKLNWAHTDYQNRTPGSGIGDARYWQREAYGSASVLFTPTDWLSLDYAADVVYNSLNSTLAIYALHPHRTTFLNCLAAKVQRNRLTVVARGLYLDSSTDNSSLMPSVSLSYRLLPREPFYLRLMAKQVYRLPTFNELYYYHIGSSQLKPEKASQVNLGLTYQSINNYQLKINNYHLPSITLTADLYINKVSDKIVAVPFNMFVWRIMNLDRATIVGLDLTASAGWSLGQGHVLAFHGNYSWQRAMNDAVKASPAYHNQLPYTPHHTFCTSLSWENPWVNATLTTSGQSCRWTTVEHSPGTRISGFTVSDISLWREFKKAPVTLRLTAQNVFNRQYDLVAHYPMPGRSILLQLTILAPQCYASGKAERTMNN